MNKCRILFLAANPNETTGLALDEEIRSIHSKIREAAFRDSVELVSRWAVRPDDIELALLEVKPHIVHFSGHGSDQDELILTDDSGRSKPVSKEAIVGLFRILKDNVRLVVLNACFSRPQVEGLVEVIDCAIGMNKAIGDEAAICFSASLYRGLGFGRTINDSFELGKNALLREGIREEDTPVLFCHPDANPAEISLVNPQ